MRRASVRSRPGSSWDWAPRPARWPQQQLLDPWSGRTVPVAAAVTTTAATVWDGWARAYPGALGGAVIAVALVWLAAYAWIRALSPRQEGQRMTVSPGGATVVA